jgi:flagellar secretion chaperone FliS
MSSVMQHTMARGAEAYRQTHVQSRSPLELIVMLYDGALRFLRDMATAMEHGDLVAKRDALSRALAIIAELQGTLNVEQGGETAASLDRLYTYMIERLSEANIQLKPAPVHEVIRLMTELREAWAQAAQAPPPAA